MEARGACAGEMAAGMPEQTPLESGLLRPSSGNRQLAVSERLEEIHPLHASSVIMISVIDLDPKPSSKIT